MNYKLVGGYPKVVNLSQEAMVELLHHPSSVKTPDEAYQVFKRRHTILLGCYADLATLRSARYQDPAVVDQRHLADVAARLLTGMGANEAWDVDAILRDPGYAAECLRGLPKVTGVEVKVDSLRHTAWAEFEGGRLPGAPCERQDWALACACAAYGMVILEDLIEKQAAKIRLAKRGERRDRLEPRWDLDGL